jgi:hypothetical protein
VVETHPNKKDDDEIYTHGHSQPSQEKNLKEQEGWERRKEKVRTYPTNDRKSQKAKR